MDNLKGMGRGGVRLQSEICDRRIVTELSSSIILYSNKSITLTMSTYLAILRGNDGIAAAFAAILTLVTTLSLLLYLKVSKSEDVRL